MGWYFRKSKSVGPFRVNFSKFGMSFSTGVKGARMSFGPRGTFVNVVEMVSTIERNWDPPLGATTLTVNPMCKMALCNMRRIMPKPWMQSLYRSKHRVYQ